MAGGVLCRGLKITNAYLCLGGLMPVEAVIAANRNLSYFFPSGRNTFSPGLSRVVFLSNFQSVVS